MIGAGELCQTFHTQAYCMWFTHRYEIHLKPIAAWQSCTDDRGIELQMKDTQRFFIFFGNFSK